MLWLAGTLLLGASGAPVITAEDGHAINALWGTPGKSAPIAILVADEGSSPEEWSATSKVLNDAKIATLSIGPRLSARGESAWADVLAAVRWAKKRTDADPTRLVVVGAGFGALAALNASSNDPEIDGIALISALIDRKRLDDDDALADYGERPVFVAVARNDKTPAKSALVLEAQAKGRKKLFIAEGSRTGADLLAKNFDAQSAFLLWTRQTLGLEAVPAETPRPSPKP